VVAGEFIDGSPERCFSEYKKFAERQLALDREYAAIYFRISAVNI